MAPSNKDDKTYWVWSQIDEALHTSLLEISTATGKHPRALIEMAIEEFVVSWTQKRKDKGLSVSPQIQLEVIVLEDRARQTRLNQIRQLAYNHIQNPTDESAEQLAQACDLAKISVEMVIEQVSSKPHIIELMDENGGLNSVEGFLAQFMEPGKMYNANDVIEAGERSGYKKYMINEAKRKLGIKSKRDRQSWVWFLPERNGEAASDEEPVF